MLACKERQKEWEKKINKYINKWGYTRWTSNTTATITIFGFHAQMPFCLSISLSLFFSLFLSEKSLSATFLLSTIKFWIICATLTVTISQSFSLVPSLYLSLICLSIHRSLFQFPVHPVSLSLSFDFLARSFFVWCNITRNTSNVQAKW